MEGCMKNINNCDWLQQWTSLAKSFAFRYNPALQPRALIVFGCISKTVRDLDVKQLLRILVRALESFQDLQLIEAIIMCLTRLHPLLRPESPIHRALSGWLYLFYNFEYIMMSSREPLEWHFKQLDHSAFRHPTPTTVSRTTRVLNTLLGIIAKPHKRDKFQVTPESVAYLAALVSVSEEVRSRCHLKHRITRVVSESPSAEAFATELHLTVSPQVSTSPSNPSPPTPSPSSNSAQTSPHGPPPPANCIQQTLPVTPVNRRHKSWDTLDQNALFQAKQNNKQSPVQQPQSKDNKVWRSLDIDAQNMRPRFKTQRSSSMPTPKAQKSEDGGRMSPELDDDEEDESRTHQEASRVSNEDNVLLDPEVLVEFPTQSLVLTVLATLVRNTTDENEMQILYEYLAEASVVFARVFPVIHSLLDSKITSVLSLCHDQVILSAVQSIIQNMISCEDSSQQQLHYLQTFGFGGLWRFAGPFSKTTTCATSSYCSQTNLDNAELFVNCLEAMVETCLPIEDGELHDLSQYPSTLSVSSTMNLSSSMSSLTLGSPTEKEPTTEYCSLVSEGSARMRHGSSNQLSRQRSLKCKNSKNGKNSH
ncbi:neurofibromin [Caerostris extrusa]|uniref:Neurofibromin n=1 Tax=Caerostris extrusa TaxID=172846 RepID=A0AAV4Y4B1_CAEEX|nr:neurofibromin [Caerostris extrusa]